jgi:hypothetical protein
MPKAWRVRYPPGPPGDHLTLFDNQYANQSYPDVFLGDYLMCDSPQDVESKKFTWMEPR